MDTNTVNSPWLSTRQAAAYLGFKETTLEVWRSTGGGPAFYRIAGRTVRYHQNDLDAWAMDRGPARNTAEADARAASAAA